MPAVSVCDPIAAALRHSLEVGQTKSSEDISIALTSEPSRILETEIQYEEAESYQSTVLDHLKAKYIVLSLPNSDQPENGKAKDTSVCRKKTENSKMTGPTLPEPKVTLYSPQKINLGWKGTFPVGAGMYNVGNTCYLNSTLQALFHVPALVNWLLSDSHHNTKCEQNEGGGECLTCAMAKTLQFSHEKSGNAIKPFYIYNKLKLICRTMVPGQQEDAHEFLRYLLEGMERAYLHRHKATKLDNYSKETTPINQIFGGYIRTEVKCLQCRHVSTTFQHFQDLLLDIRKASTLDEALSGYFSREQLDNNDYKCEACKRRVPATKQFSLERAPKVLCVQLKRFSVLGSKISRHIGFKQNVDMGPYLWREPGESPRKLNYKLMSIVTHMGPSVNCGHYTAVAQVSSGQYYSYDDSCVRSINLTNVLSTNAYIMIFEMEPQSQNQLPSPQATKLNGLTSVKTLSNGSLKAASPKPSTSGLLTSNGVCNGSSSRHDTDPIIGPQQLPRSKSPSSPQTGQKTCSNFIGPQLPSKMAEKSQPRLVMHIKNSKVLSGNSLVPYDGSSDEEENNSSSKNNINPNSSNLTKSLSTNNHQSENGILKPSKSEPSDTTKVTIISKAEVKPIKPANQIPIQKSSSPSLTQNGSSSLSLSSSSSSSSNSTSQKHQNGKSENGNNKSESKETNGKEKWHYPIRVKTGSSDDKVLTKAASSMNGWEVSKDAPSPTSTATPNGWSVTDNKEEKKFNHINSSSTPSAAAPRNFNGTNRSDTVSQLFKMSHRGYGTSSVANWNGSRAHLDREVDDERRRERKRHFNPDDEEMDRGRLKKVKNHRNYGGSGGGRSNPGYNPFQEYLNGKSWGRSRAKHHQRYNTNNNRSRHITYNKPYRYYNHHDDWHHR